MEDIINRGGGRLLIQLNNVTTIEDLETKNDVHGNVDSVRCMVKVCELIKLESGEAFLSSNVVIINSWARDVS